MPLTIVETEGGLSSALVTTLAIVAALVLAFLIAAVLGAAVRAIAKRWPAVDQISRRMRRPLRILLAIIGVWVAIRLTTEPSSWTPGVEHALTIALIIAIAWLLAEILFVVEDAIAARYPIDVPDNRHARRVRTQVQVLRRITAVVIVIVAGSAILLTFPGMRAVGASILASAGLVSIIAGLAAQTSLANIFSGMQIAFTDAIRVDDVVIVEGEWGRIEEITMTYVVVHIWDDRRLVLPSTYFTTTPFQNWTRRASQLLGTIELDVDWTVPVDGLRAEMHRLLAETDLWDHRVGIIQVTDATGGLVRIRALASAANAPILWDLRCYLREGLVRWIQQHRAGLPRTRLESVTGEAPAEALEAGRAPGPEAAAREEVREPTATAAAPTQWVPGPEDTGLFTGTADAVGRSQPFAGPGQGVIDEREETAERTGGATQVLPRISPTAEGGGTHGGT